MAIRRTTNLRTSARRSLRTLLPACLALGFSGADAADTPSPAAAAPVLELGEAQYVGSHAPSNGVEVYRGLPFAAAPVGDRRWRPPAPPEPRPGRHDANDFAPACLQGGYMGDWYRDVVAGFGGDPGLVVDPRESEDCLYLNVWRPGPESGEGMENPRPVIVFIHGGGNTGGWSWEPNYHGQKLAEQGFLVVTPAYRLGVFGFYSHPDEPHANFALLDQVAALRWIRTHADALGADPERITVMGESSGGNNIIHLMALPEARGLFQRAVVQSAGWALRETPHKREQEANGTALQEAVLGAGGNLEALRAAPADDVFRAARTVYAESGFDPVVDGVSLAQPVIDTVNGGGLADVDLLIGSNRDEWRMYLPEPASFEALRDRGLPESAREPTRALVRDGATLERALDRVITAWQMVCPSLHLAAAVARDGGRSWVYWFTRQRPGTVASTMGAYHGAELPYVFDTHDDWLPTDADDRTLTRTIVTYWSAFAKSGDPNAMGLPSWPVYEQPGDEVLRLDVTPGPVTHPELGLCDSLGVTGQAGTRRRPTGT